MPANTFLPTCTSRFGPDPQKDPGRRGRGPGPRLSARILQRSPLVNPGARGEPAAVSHTIPHAAVTRSSYTNCDTRGNPAANGSARRTAAGPELELNCPQPGWRGGANTAAKSPIRFARIARFGALPVLITPYCEAACYHLFAAVQLQTGEEKLTTAFAKPGYLARLIRTPRFRKCRASQIAPGSCRRGADVFRGDPRGVCASSRARLLSWGDRPAQLA